MFWKLNKNRKNDVPPVRELRDQRPPQEIQVDDLIPDFYLQTRENHRLLRVPGALQDNYRNVISIPLIQPKPSAIAHEFQTTPDHER